MKYALVQKGEVVEIREDVILDAPIAVHRDEDGKVAEAVRAVKLADDGGPMLRPITETPQPPFSLLLQTCERSFLIKGDEVVEVWTVVEKPKREQIQRVKDECGRRIYARFPQWKQANLTARAVELLAVSRDLWSEADRAEWDELQAAFDWVKSVRNASNALEALDPIPTDFTSDIYWPTQLGDIDGTVYDNP